MELMDPENVHYYVLHVIVQKNSKILTVTVGVMIPTVCLNSSDHAILKHFVMIRFFIVCKNT